MWNTILAINGVIWVFTSIYFIYSIGAGILKGDGHQFFLGFGFFLLSFIIEIILGSLAK